MIVFSAPAAAAAGVAKLNPWFVTGFVDGGWGFYDFFNEKLYY